MVLGLWRLSVAQTSAVIMQDGQTWIGSLPGPEALCRFACRATSDKCMCCTTQLECTWLGTFSEQSVVLLTHSSCAILMYLLHSYFGYRLLYRPGLFNQ